MRGIRSLRKLMNQAVTIAPRTGEDARGKPIYGTASTYQARVVGKRRQVIDTQGQQVVSSQTVILASGDQVLPDALLTLSTADVGSTESWAIQPPIIGTARYPDPDGSNAYTALFLR